MNHFSLQGKCAVMTGGRRGRGRAIALGLAEAGADTLITYREKAAEAADVVKAIEAIGRRAQGLQMEVTDRASVAAAAAIADKFGAISILVNNAGINKPTDFDQIEDADWDAVLAANLEGPFLAAQIFLPLMQKAAESILLRRMGRPQEVADAVVFLASDAASYITAQTLNVNGGLYF